jgi:hypothetical protein
LELALGESVAYPSRSLLIGMFGSFELVHARIGVYSVAAYAARQRTREIGGDWLFARMISTLNRPRAADAAQVVVALLLPLLCAVSATFLPARPDPRVSPREAIGPTYRLGEHG